MSQRIATAEWADPSEFSNKYKYKDGAFWLGRSPVMGAEQLGFSDDRHICLVSGSRAGKGTTTIINNLCLWPGSIVVVDPKGENATVTAARRGPGSKHCDGMGQKVHVLDPFNAAQVDEDLKSRFNPLDALDPNNEETIDEAGRLADAIVVIQPDSKDPFWDESARSMIKVLILHVLTDPDYKERRNLLTLRELIMRGDYQSVQALTDIGEEDIPTGHELLWEGLARNKAFRGVVAGAGETFRNMAVNSPKQFESVLQVANRNTEFIDSPGMQRCLSESDFAISDLKTDPKGVSIYLSLPQRFMNTHFRWLRMMIALIVTEMEMVKGQPKSGHRVLMCLDEFAGLKKMEVIQNAVAQIAGFGVKLFFILQSLEQLKATYKDNWETFLSNAGLKIFFGLEDHFTREYVSKLIGDTELIRDVRSGSETRGESESATHGTSKSSSTSRSQSDSTSESESDSRSRSKSDSQNWGGNSSTGTSSGSSTNKSWAPPWLPFRSTAKYLTLLRKDERVTFGKNAGQSSSEGKSWGNSSSSTDGSSKTHGSSRSRTDGLSWSDTDGSSESDTSGYSQSSTSGTSETVHRRPLISPDEMGRFFSRISDTYDRSYPGLGLVLISGERPGVVQRMNYDEDGIFRRRFDPHPEHRAPEKWYERTIEGPDRALLDYAAPSGNFVYVNMHAKPGGYIREGEPFFTLKRLDNAYAKGLPLELTFAAPVSGYIANVPPGELHVEQYDLKIFKREDNEYKKLTPKILTHDASPNERIEMDNTEALGRYCINTVKEYQKHLKEIEEFVSSQTLKGILVVGGFQLLHLVDLGTLGLVLGGISAVYIYFLTNGNKLMFPGTQQVPQLKRIIKECPVNISQYD